jgi:hypothetical protein
MMGTGLHGTEFYVFFIISFACEGREEEYFLCLLLLLFVRFL